MYSWIQDPRVIDQQGTPIHMKQGACGNWWQQEIIRGFFSDCECRWIICGLATCSHQLQREYAKNGSTKRLTSDRRPLAQRRLPGLIKVRGGLSQVSISTRRGPFRHTVILQITRVQHCHHHHTHCRLRRRRSCIHRH